MTTTTTFVLRLVLVMTMTAATTLAVKGFRLRTLGVERSRGYRPPPPPPPHYYDLAAVLDQLDQLTTRVVELQSSVDEVHEAVRAINDSLDPAVVRQSTYSPDLSMDPVCVTRPNPTHYK